MVDGPPWERAMTDKQTPPAPSVREASPRRPRRVSAGDTSPSLSAAGLERYSVDQAVAAAQLSKDAAVQDILGQIAPGDIDSLLQTLGALMQGLSADDAVALRHALESGEITVHYQPIVSLGTGEITGVEALARWQRPGQGLIPPVEFIPIAEETGLINELGAMILRQACRRMVALAKAIRSTLGS